MNINLSYIKKGLSICIAITLFSTVKVFGQDADTAKLAKDFTKYASSALPEKIYVHTDKNSYNTGELLWFKLYNVDGVLNKPIDISKVAYVELLDADQNPVLQSKIQMEGEGSGSLYLPVTLSTGNYVLRAYTNWMKNFNAEYFFTKQIAIINPLRSPEKPVSNLAVNCTVSFFPEGGKLVAGINSVVGFKGVNQWGHSVDFTGAILDQKNDTIARFKPTALGMGRFSFTPQAGSTYRAVITANKQTFKASFLDIAGNGYVMQVADDGADKLAVTVTSNQPAENIYLLAQSHNVVRSVQVASINGTARFEIDKNKLGEGVSQITILNSDKKPVCERLVFRQPSKRLQIKATSDGATYNERQKVNLQATIADQQQHHPATSLSVSVYRVDSLQQYGDEDILSYLWLRSDLRGLIENPAYYFSSADASASLAADNLMLTQGWRTFDWTAIQSGKAPAFSFAPEFNGPIVSAKVTSSVSGKPTQGIIAYLGVVGKSVQLSTSQSDANGKLYFNMHNFYGPAELVAETNTKVDSNYKIDILSPFSDQRSQAAIAPLQITPSMQNAFADQSLAVQVQNVYSANQLWQFNNPHADSSAFYGTPQKTYLLDNYTRFVTTEEVMREYVREVNVIHLNNQFHIKVMTVLMLGLSDKDPLVLIDGVPFFNMNKVFAIDPLKFRKLEAVPFSYQLGAARAEGIFSFTSYKGDLGGAEIDPKAVIIDYEGLQKQRRFYSPIYDDTQHSGRLPDMRTLLFWSPDVKSGTDGSVKTSFYTSDQAGKYIAVFQGLNTDGAAGSGTTSFEVK